jgi:hypothetical protein
MRCAVLLLASLSTCGCVVVAQKTTVNPPPPPTKLLAPVAIPTPDALLKFNEPYGLYFRRYFGCPDHATLIEECRPNGPVRNDQSAFRKACAAARKLFGFKDEGSCKL